MRLEIVLIQRQLQVSFHIDPLGRPPVTVGSDRYSPSVLSTIAKSRKKISNKYIDRY